MAQVPAYIEYLPDGQYNVITQSLAIMEYLQEKYPEKGINILTSDINQRAKVVIYSILKIHEIVTYTSFLMKCNNQNNIYLGSSNK